MKIKKLIKYLKKARKSGLKEVVVSGFVGLNNRHTVFTIKKHKGETYNFMDGLNRLHIHVKASNHV